MNLLVYGSLRRFHHNHRVLQGACGEQGAALVKTLRVKGFNLHEVGWFPGVVPAVEGEITCELYQIPPQAFRNIDQYEACDPTSKECSLFWRENVLLDDGTEAQIYVYNGKEVGPLVQSGDWEEKHGTQ